MTQFLNSVLSVALGLGLLGACSTNDAADPPDPLEVAPTTTAQHDGLPCVDEGANVGVETVEAGAGEPFEVAFLGGQGAAEREAHAVVYSCTELGDIGEAQWILQTTLSEGRNWKLPLPDDVIIGLDELYDQSPLPFAAPDGLTPGWYAMCWETQCVSLLITS